MGQKTFDSANPSVKQVDVYADFTGGINTEQAESNMKDNQFRNLVNFDLDLGGSLTKRPGLYRMPLIKEKMKEAMEKVFGSDLADVETRFQMLDCVEFFDGLNWVLNFISNVGLGVAILDADLKVIPFNGKPGTDPNFVFYKDIIHNVKISSYSDINILMTSKYIVQPSEYDEKQKQIKMYSWNPIPKNLSVGLQNDKKWVEASSTLTDSTTDTYFGDAEYKTLTQEEIGLPIQQIANVDIEITKNNYTDQWVMFDNLNLTVEYNPTTTIPTLDFFWFNVSNATFQSHKEEIKYDNAGVEWFRGDRYIHQMTAQLFQGYFWFSFYQPATSSIYSIKLKNDSKITSISPENFANLISIDYTKKNAFVSVLGVKDFSERATNFNMSQLGVGIVYKSDSFQDSNKIDAINKTESDIWTKNAKNSIFPIIKISDNINDLQKDSFIGTPNFVLPPRQIIKTNQNFDILKNLPFTDISPKNGYEISNFYHNTQNNSDNNIIWNSSLHDSTLVVPKIMFSSSSLSGFGTTSILPYIDASLPGAYWKEVSNPRQHIWPGYQKNSARLSQIADNLPPGVLPESGGLAQVIIKTFCIPSNASNTDGKFYISRSISYENPLVIFSKKVEKRDISNKTPMIQNKPSSFPFNKDVTFLAKTDIIGVNPTKDLIDIREIFYSMDPKRKESHTWSKETNSVGFAFTASNIRLIFNSQENIVEYLPLENFHYAGLLSNNLFITGLKNLSGLEKLLRLNGKSSVLEKLFIDINWNKFLGEETIKELKNIDKVREQELLTLLKLSFKWTDRNLVQKSLNIFLSQNDTILIMQNIINNKDYKFRVYSVKRSNSEIVSIKIETSILLGGKEKIFVLFDSMTNKEIPKDEYTFFVSSLLFIFTAIYYPKGLVNNVIQFKQLTYTKPNLNDLSYLWYNFILFNKYQEQTNPNIYDKKIFNHISTDLIKYPENGAITQPVQLYGIVPVNNLILSPGEDQSFQIFFDLKDRKWVDNIWVAGTAMPLSDYISRINAADYDTVKSLEWITWPKFFGQDKSYWLDKDAKAIWNITIPSTTSPYVLIIQSAKKKPVAGKEGTLPPDDNNEYPGVSADDMELDLATIVETRIEMSPQSNIIEKIDISTLFDEISTTSQLKMFETASTLVAFGGSNKIFFSDISVPTYFPVSRIIQLKTPESIISAVMFQNKLIVSTQNSRHYIGGTSFDSDLAEERHTVKLISTDSGVISRKFDVAFGDRLYFLDQNGIKYLKNLYGTADKEFTFSEADSLIKSLVDSSDRNALAVSHKDKLFVNFPNSNTMLVYVKQYDSWISYKSKYMSFSRLFAKDGELYAISKNDFAVYKFDKNVMVDNWNEFDGYVEYISPDNTISKVQNGDPIECSFETKGLNQNYIPHQKKYLSTTLNVSLIGANSSLIPTLKVDDNIINYDFAFYSDYENTMHYKELSPGEVPLVTSLNFKNYSKDIITGSSHSNFVLGKSLLGDIKDAFYTIPIRRKGNTITLKIEFNAPSVIIINNFSIRYEIRKIKGQKGGHK